MAIVCASPSRFRTPTGSGCRTSASRRSTASSTPKTTSSANGSFCRRRQELAELSAAKAPLLTLESQTPVGDFDVVAFSVSFEWDYVNVLTLLRLAGIPSYAAERTPRHPLIVVGGAVTFVNPEPLAPFADVIAAGEGEVLVPGLRRAVSAATDRADLLRLLSAERGFYVPSFYEPQYAADGTLAGYTVRAGVDAPLPGAQGGAEDDRRGGPAGDQHLHARHRVRIALPHRSGPRLREPVPLLLGRLQLPAGPRVSDRPHPGAREGCARARKPRRARVHRALRPSGHRAHPREPPRDGLRHQPRVAAARRSHRVDRPGPAGERRADDHHRAGNRLGSAPPRDQQDRDERRDSRSGRPDLRERHREPEALLHDRPPHRDRRGPGGDSRSDAADPRPHDEVRAPEGARSAASSAA